MSEGTFARWKKVPSGEWMVFGPKSLLAAKRGPVAIRKADGSMEHRHIWWTSKPFLVDGVPHCFGRPDAKRECVACGGWHHSNEVRAIYAGGVMRTGAYWRQGEDTCSCGGRLA